MDNRNDIELLLDLHKELAVTREHMAEVRADLREHIKRTAIIETELKFIHKQIWLAHGAVALLGILGTIISVFKIFV